MDSADALHDDVNEALRRAADEFGLPEPRLRELRDMALRGQLNAEDIVLAARFWQEMGAIVQAFRPGRRIEEIENPLHEVLEITFDMAVEPERFAKQTEPAVRDTEAYGRVVSVVKSLDMTRRHQKWNKQERAAIRLLFGTKRTWHVVRRAARAPRRRTVARGTCRRTSASRDGPPPEPDHPSECRERVSDCEVRQ
jgi:hypothetical protein